MEIFSKKLSKTDVTKRCLVPMKYFKKECFPKPTSRLAGNHQDFEVTDESGHDWILCCSTRDIGKDPDHPKHPKPELIKQWIPFVRSKRLHEGDRVIISEEQDETGLMQRRIRVEKHTSTFEARWSPIMNQNLDENKGSTSHNSANESPATFQPFEDHLVDNLNHDLGGKTATTTSSIDKEHIPSPHTTSQDSASYKTKRPRLNSSLQLTLKTTMTRGTTAATSSSINKQTPTSHSTSQDIEAPSLSLNLGLTLTPTIRGGQQYAYMQDAEPKTIDFLGRFL